MTGSIGERSYVAIPWTGDYAYGGSVLIQSGNVSAQGGGSGKVGTSAGAAGVGGKGAQGGIGSGGGGGGAGTTGGTGGRGGAGVIIITCL